MHDEPSLDNSLASLSGQADAAVSDGFFDEVWQRAGQLQERADQKNRLMLFCGLFVVGLGAGFSTILPADAAKANTYQLGMTDQLSPAALLHVEP